MCIQLIILNFFICIGIFILFMSYLFVTGLSQQLLFLRLFHGNDLGVDDASFNTLFHSFCHSSSVNTKPYCKIENVDKIYCINLKNIQYMHIVGKYINWFAQSLYLFCSDMSTKVLLYVPFFSCTYFLVFPKNLHVFKFAFFFKYQNIIIIDI